MRWPGDEGGWSTANLLLGKSSPAGRLPVTWGKRLEDYPATDPAHPERSAKGVNGKTTYTEGVDVGYRWFDRKRIDPLFPFGYGLSYSSFEYSRLVVTKTTDGGLNVTVTIRNQGNVSSDEVPQVYIGAPDSILAGVQVPVRTFAAFERIRLAPGESKTVTLHVEPRQLQCWAPDKEKWVTVRGERKVYVGASSRDLRLQSLVDEP
jgi:beta-glucosidase